MANGKLRGRQPDASSDMRNTETYKYSGEKHSPEGKAKKMPKKGKRKRY